MLAGQRLEIDFWIIGGIGIIPVNFNPVHYPSVPDLFLPNNGNIVLSLAGYNT
jgi:hypothetical protein